MKVQCYTSRASLRSALIGGLFVLQDGARYLIPDNWLSQAEILRDACLVRLHYSFCIIEIAGRFLEAIFEDAGIGRLGIVQIAPAQMVPAGQLWVTSITVTAPSSQSISTSGRERWDT